MNARSRGLSTTYSSCPVSTVAVMGTSLVVLAISMQHDATAYICRRRWHALCGSIRQSMEADGRAPALTPVVPSASACGQGGMVSPDVDTHCGRCENAAGPCRHCEATTGEGGAMRIAAFDDAQDRRRRERRDGRRCHRSRAAVRAAGPGGSAARSDHPLRRAASRSWSAGPPPAAASRWPRRDFTRRSPGRRRSSA